MYSTINLSKCLKLSNQLTRPFIPLMASSASSFLLYWQKENPLGFLVSLSFGINTGRRKEGISVRENHLRLLPS